jgi:3-hydroxyacyl-[acyl-carrier-protein] dehydratase
LTGLDRVRFRKPVVPGDRLELDVSVTRHRAPLWRLQGVARVDDTVVAEAELLLTQINEAAARV